MLAWREWRPLSIPALVAAGALELYKHAGDLPAGSKLNEAAIADLLGVSRGPVREAVRALEESGLVRLEKNRGVFVRQIGVEEADEIYELRSVLDEFVGRRVAQEGHDAGDLRLVQPALVQLPADGQRRAKGRSWTLRQRERGTIAARRPRLHRRSKGS